MQGAEHCRGWGAAPRHPSASHGGCPHVTALSLVSRRLHGLLAEDSAMLQHCRPDSFGVHLCQIAGLSKGMSRMIITPRNAGRSFPTLAEDHPARAAPAWSCQPAAGRGESTGDPQGQQEGEQNRPKNLLKSAGKSGMTYKGKGRHSWRERSRRGFLQTTTTQDWWRGVCALLGSSRWRGAGISKFGAV